MSLLQSRHIPVALAVTAAALIFIGVCCALMYFFFSAPHTRLLGVVGVALGALGIGTLGLAADVTSLALIYALGMIGIGMFHPMGATTIGYLHSHNRNTAVSLFFVAGMIGGVLGALLWPRVLSMRQGVRYLPLAILPAAALIVFMQRSFVQLAPAGNSSASIPVTQAPRVARDRRPP